ncbi:MAG TPA: hypothetical protein VFA71_11600 [Terriglobales bacterium]|nr:hypothetical protein [Terriglobales bacterium]
MPAFTSGRQTARFDSMIFGLIVLLALTMAGCGTNSNNMTRPVPTPTPTPSPTPTPTPTPPPIPVTWDPTTSPLPAPPAVEPPPPAETSFPLSVSTPSNGATVNSPAHVVAASSPSNPILYMRVYVDGLAVYFTFEKSFDTLIWMAPGQHTLEVMAVDRKGFVSTSVMQVTVAAQSPFTVSNIQALPGWQTCSAVFPPEAARHGQICAAGLGTAVVSMTPGQSTPSLDGNSTKFSIAGPTGYSNELWFNPVGGGNSVTHFVYDLWFLIDKPLASQALEFDINQTFGGQRWTWGTECNFNASGKWDIWDPLHETWVPTSVDCKPFPANTWIHLIWNFERVNGKAHYISVTVDNQTFNVDQFFDPQQNWTLEEIDAAFQMDGNFTQEPYNVWLDKVNLQVF